MQRQGAALHRCPLPASACGVVRSNDLLTVSHFECAIPRAQNQSEAGSKAPAVASWAALRLA